MLLVVNEQKKKLFTLSSYRKLTLHKIHINVNNINFVLNSFSQNSRVCMCLCTKKSKIKIIMINSSKISIHRFIATALFRVVKECMATIIRQYSRMIVKLQELAIKANLGLLWYLQTVAIVK